MLKKRMLSLALASVMVLSTLAGCGKATDTSTASTGEVAPSTTAAVTEQSQPVTLTYLTYDGAKDASGNYQLEKQIAAYKEVAPNVTITVDRQTENNSVDFLKKLDLLQLSGVSADMILLPSYRDFADRALKDFFAPIDDSLKNEGKTYDEMYSYPAQINDKTYAIPYNPAIYHVLINKTMLDAAGLAIPSVDWTWEDYAKYSKAMTSGEGSNKIYGSYMHTWSEYRREGLFASKLDNPYVKDDGTSNLDDPNLKTWLQFMYNMENVDQSQVRYYDAKATKMAYRDVFFQGKAAMTLTGSWIYDDINNIEKFPHDFETVFASFPRWNNSPVGRTQGSCSYMSVGKGSKNVEEAYKYLRWMSDDGAKAINYLPSVKGADFTPVIKAKVGENAKLYNLDSLLAIWNNKSLAPNIITKFPESYKALDDIFNVETEKFMTDGQDLDTTINNMVAQSKEILK